MMIVPIIRRKKNEYGGRQLIYIYFADGGIESIYYYYLLYLYIFYSQINEYKIK